MQPQQESNQIIEARGILDDIFNDEKSPLYDVSHPMHSQVTKAVAALEAEISRLTLALDSDTCINKPNRKGESKLNSHREEIVGYLAEGKNFGDVAKILGCARSTVALWLENHPLV